MTILQNEEAARNFVAARCEPKDFERLERFVSLLSHANLQQNLVAAGTLNSVWVRHIADSAQLLDHVPRETNDLWLDLGTGAGFPGLVLAIMQPRRTFGLVESRGLRVRWLEEAVALLNISNCSVIGSDIRRVQDSPAGAITARAFAPLTRLLALSARFSTETTHWVLPKGRSAKQELTALPIAQRKMFHVEQSVTDRNAGIIVGVGKPEF